MKAWGWILLLVSSLSWADPEQDLLKFYETVESLQADFEQRLIDEDGDTLERYAGRLWLQRPGRFLWIYDTPYPLQLGSDGLKLWHFDVDLRQITVRDASASLSGTPAELLGGAKDQLANYRLKRLPDDGELERLQLIPNGGDSDFAEIVIGMQDGQPRRIQLADRLGQVTRIELHDLRANQPIEKARFSLVVPDGVTLVDERPAP